MDGVIDWGIAGQVARGVAGLQPAGERAPFEAVSEPAAESERLVSAYTGLVPTSPLPAPEAVDRSEWIAANLDSLRGVLDPVAGRLGSRLGPVGGAAGMLLAIEAGAISGFLAGRVLGQYEFAPLDPEGPGAAAVRAAQPGARRQDARRRPRPAAALGRPARDDARAPVRRRAVAAGAPGRPHRRDAGRRSTSTRRGSCVCRTPRTSAAWSSACAATASRSLP